MALPERLSDDGDRCRAGFLFLGGERPSRDQMDPENARQLRADAVAGKLLGLTRSGEDVVVVGIDRGEVEALRLCPPVEKVQHRDVVDRRVQLVVPLEDQQQPVRIFEGQRPQYLGIHHAEDGGGGGDGQANGQHHGCGEERGLAHEPQGIRNILGDRHRDLHETHCRARV